MATRVEERYQRALLFAAELLSVTVCSTLGMVTGNHLTGDRRGRAAWQFFAMADPAAGGRCLAVAWVRAGTKRCPESNGLASCFKRVSWLSRSL